MNQIGDFVPPTLPRHYAIYWFRHPFQSQYHPIWRKTHGVMVGAFDVGGGQHYGMYRITTHLFGWILGSEECPCPTLSFNPLFMMIWPLVIKISSVFDVLGEDDILVCISITTHLFGSILGSEEGQHPMLALNSLFMMIRPLDIKILLVYIVLGEDDILVCISITTHLFDLILGSEEHPWPTLSLNPLYVMMQPLVIKISLVFDILGKIPAGYPYPWKTLTLWKGRGTSWVRAQVDIWTPMGTPLLITITWILQHSLQTFCLSL